MRIKSLELTNWGPHKKCKFNMDSSIVGIVGANGRGKSNLLQAIDYALTGNLNKQKQEMYIRNYGQPDGAKSASVTLIFEKGGKECTITRTITASGTKRRLVWDGNEWTKAADVKAVMETILEADKDALAQAVFIKQGELSRLIKGAPAERQTIFQKLMNLGFLDSCPDDLSAKIGALRGTLQDVRPTLELALQDLANVQEKLEPLKGSKEKHDNLQAAITDLSVIGDALASINILRTKVTANDNAVRNAQVNAKAAEARLGQGITLPEAKAKLQQLENEQAECKQALETCLQHKALLKNYELAKAALQQAEESLRELPGCDALRAQKQSIEAERDIALSMLQFVDTKANLQERLTAVEASYQSEQIRLNKCKNRYDTESPALIELIATEKAVIAHLAVQVNHAKARAFAFCAGASDALCPVCNTPMTAEHFLQDGETEEDCKRRLDLEVSKLEASIAEHNASLAKHEMLLANMTAGLNGATLDTLSGMRNEELSLLEAHIKLCPAGFDETKHTKCVLESNIAQLDETLRENTRMFGQVQAAMNASMLAEMRVETAKDALPTQDAADEAELRSAYEKLYTEYVELRSLVNEAVTAADLVATTEAAASADRAKLDSAEANIVTLWEKAEENAELVEAWLLVDTEEALCRTSAADVERVLRTLREMQSAASQDYALFMHLTQDKNTLNQRVGELQELIATNAEKLKLIDDLNVVKSMVMRTGVPLAFMNDVFHKLVVYVQDLLLRMGANFTVLPDKEHACSFLFMRTDDTSSFEMRQERLSGGQAIRLALAMLLACQQIILPEVGLLVLDEPSSHIDSAGVDQMRDMFLSLQQILQNSDMQLIIVDHNEKLTTAFETTITL